MPPHPTTPPHRTTPLYRSTLAAAILLAQPGLAEGLVALRTIPARTVIAAEDLTIRPGLVAGDATPMSDVVGLEARVTIFRGQPVGPDDVVRPALVERNATVTLVYRRDGLTIEEEGRAMARATAGDRIKVLNTGSRIVVTGRVTPDGTVEVGLN
jgi:flagella basal body P-ring formation protein FlgA